MRHGKARADAMKDELNWRSRSLRASFNYALQGIVYALLTQRNMRIHVLLAGLVLTLAVLLRVTRVELLILLLTIGLVIAAELINTAIEAVVNLVTQEYHPIARDAKNVAAGAVFVSSVVSLCVAYVVFIERLLYIDSRLIRPTYGSPLLTLVAVLTVATATVVLKAFSGRSDLLRGGMPSGHAAIAFSLATAVFFVGEGLSVFFGAALAVLVAQSRMESRVHSFLEVLIGALLGVSITVLFFQMRG